MREAAQYDVRDWFNGMGPVEAFEHVKIMLNLPDDRFECGFHYDDEGVARVYVKSPWVWANAPKTIQLRLSTGDIVLAGLDYYGGMELEGPQEDDLVWRDEEPGR